MDNYLIEKTYKTPKILLDSQEGLIEISGRSIPENALKLYKPVVEWISQYLVNPKEITTVNIQLSFFNTSTSKYLMEILMLFKGVINQGFKVDINWSYDDEDILDLINDYQNLLNIPINKIPDSDFISDSD